MHICLPLSFWPIHAGGVCVCVCETLGITGNPLILEFCRGAIPHCNWLPDEESCNCGWSLERALSRRTCSFFDLGCDPILSFKGLIWANAFCRCERSSSPWLRDCWDLPVTLRCLYLGGHVACGTQFSMQYLECVCVCPTLDKGSYLTTFPQAGGQWTTITHCPTKTVIDRSWSNAGRRIVYLLSFSTSCHPTFPRFDSWWFHMILSPQTGFPLHCSCWPPPPVALVVKPVLNNTL